jgi:hypothetical protein
MGRKIPPIILDNKEELPSFKLMEEDSEITPDQNYSSVSALFILFISLLFYYILSSPRFKISFFNKYSYFFTAIIKIESN